MHFVKKALILFLRFSVSIVLLILLFKFNKIDLYELVDDIRAADKLLLVSGFLVYFLTYIIGFLRWHMLLKTAGINIPVKRLVTSFAGGTFFSIFLPSTIGGDLVRAADLSGHTRKTKEVIATVFLDRLSGYIGLVILVITAFVFGSSLLKDKVVFYSIAVILSILVAVILVLFNAFIYKKIAKFLSTPGAEKIKEAIKGVHHEIHVFRNRKRIVVGNIILSVIVQFVPVVSAYFIALSLGIKIGFVYFCLFLPIIGAISLLPIALGGLGLREGLFVFYFAKVGVIQQLALAMSLLSFSFVVFYGALGGIFYVLTVHHRRVQRNTSS